MKASPGNPRSASVLMLWLCCLMLALPAVSPAFSQTTTADAPPTTQPAEEQAPADDAPQADAAPAQPLVDEQAIDLRPRFVQGRTTRYSFWSTRQQAVTIQIAGETQNVATTMEFQGEITWAVNKVHDDGSATCTLTHDHLAVTITQPNGQVQVVDSRKNQGDNPQVLRFFQALVGVPITYEMAPDGSPAAVSGTQVIAQRLGEELAAMVPAEEEHLETATELATLPHAPATLAVGGNWQARFDWKHEVGRMILPMNYQLASVEVIAGIPVAMVDFSAQPEIKPDYSKIPANGPKVDIRQTQGSYQGQVMFDLQRHDVAGFNASRVIGLNIRVTLPQGRTLVRQVTETLQNQLLRIEEVQ